MSSGIRIWSASGALQMDENSFTVGISYSALVAKTAGRFVDIAVDGVTPSTHSAVCVPIAQYDTSGQIPSAIGFIPEILNGVVRVWFGNRLSNSGPVGTSTQRLLVMRYR